jgi:predicted DNA-binding protein (UPF0251 family)
MPRPKLCRIISDMPDIEGFRPIGVPMPESDPVVLLFEEYEALKLMDYKGLTQEESSVLMDVSRPTLQGYMKRLAEVSHRHLLRESPCNRRRALSCLCRRGVPQMQEGKWGRVMLQKRE